MKKIIPLLLALLFSGSMFAAEAGTSIDAVVRPAHIGPYHEIKGSQAGPLTIRDLLRIYADKSDKRASVVVKGWAGSEWARSKTLEAVEQIAADAVKVKDPRASIYTRAAEKLGQQMKETSIRQDAQTAVADALKALDAK